MDATALTVQNAAMLAQSAQAKARCEPINGKAVWAWSNLARYFHSFVEWQARHPKGAPLASIAAMRFAN